MVCMETLSVNKLSVHNRRRFNGTMQISIYCEMALLGVPLMMAPHRVETRWVDELIVLLKTIKIFGRADPKALQA